VARIHAVESEMHLLSGGGSKIRASKDFKGPGIAGALMSSIHRMVRNKKKKGEKSTSEMVRGSVEIRRTKE